MKKYTCFIFILCFVISIQAQNKYWARKYKYYDVQEFTRSVFVSSDSILLIGHSFTLSSNWTSYSLYLNLFGDSISYYSYINPNGRFALWDITCINEITYATGYQSYFEPPDSSHVLLVNLNNNVIKNTGTPLLKAGGRAIINTNDGNFVIAGQAEYEAGVWQPYAVKTDTMGNIIWEQVYDTYPLLNWLTDIIPVPNEPAYYVIGTVGFNVFNGDILLAKISDATGEMLWDTIYNFGGVDGAGDIIRSQTGGYIIGGASEGLSNTFFKGAVFKVDNDFIIEWYNNQLFENCGCSSLKELPDGNIIVAACNDPNGAYAQMEIAKLRGSNGTIMWRRLYGGSWHDYAYDLALAPDGGFIVAGRQDTIIPGAPIGHASAWLLKLNCMGLLTQPAAAFSYEPQGANEIQFTNLSLYAYPDSTDGGYYIWDFGDGSPPYLCGQGYTPCTGNTLTHQYPTPGTYTATLTAIVCTDTSVVQALIDTEGAGGTVGTVENSPPAEDTGVVGVVVYPNPAQNTLTFALNNVLKSPSGDLGVNGSWQVGDLGVTILTLTGQTVLETTLAAGQASKTISVAHLPAGVYVCRWQSGASGASGHIKVAVVR